MFDTNNQPPLWLYPARITGIDAEKRVLSVEWIGTEGGRQNVIMTNDSGSYNMPDIGDTGLVIGNGLWYFWIGKVEYGYRDKCAGKIKDQDTGRRILAKLINEGEIFIGNIKNRIALSMQSNGSFSFINGFLDGIVYTVKYRIMQLAGQRVELNGNGVNVVAGSCVRDLPGVGTTVMPDESGTANAQEFFVEVLKSGVRTARIHLGYVRNALGIDEVGSWGTRLRALLEICDGPIPIAVLKVDDSGNIEISSLLGNVMVNSGTSGIIQLGGLGAVQRIPLGTNLLEWLNAHTHGSAVGPTSQPIVIADESLLSKKTFTS
jgi:hypothetical protein